MTRLLKISAIFAIAGLAACTAASNEDVLASATGPQAGPAQQEPVASQDLASQPDFETSLFRKPKQAGTPGNQPRVTSSFASENNAFAQPQTRQRAKKTYLINGLASNIGNIGIGFTNLSRKIPGSVLHNYASFVESSTVIRSRVTKELKAAYRKNPNLEINLIGISFGANIVTIIAQELDRSKIPVNYLATLDGPAMLPIRKNVRVTDNFTCTNLDCFKTNTRLGWGNKKTIKDSFRLKSSHIPLANNPRVHARILQQINAAPPLNNTVVQ